MYRVIAVQPTAKGSARSGRRMVAMGSPRGVRPYHQAPRRGSGAGEVASG